jgi:hypothetical protein
MPSITPDEPPSRPRARYLAPSEIVTIGGRCRAGKCRQPVAVVTWRRYRWRGQVRVVERFVCIEHGGAFARRYSVEIQSAPDAPEGGRS